MKICQTYPDNAKKLFHCSFGDVIRFKNNDSTPNDDKFYMVIEPAIQRGRGVATHHTSHMVLDILTGKQTRRSVSCRVVLYPDACITPGDEA